MALNDAAIRALKPKSRVYAVADDKGLCIEVALSGSKLWRFRYRVAGRARNLSFGRYPEVSLKEARQRRDEARAVLRDGVDPGVERKRAKLTARFNASNTFAALADEYIGHKLVKEGRAAVTVQKARWLLLQLKLIADQPIAEISLPSFLLFSVALRANGNTKRPNAAVPSQAACFDMPLPRDERKATPPHCSAGS